MTYGEFPPSPALASFVECYWIVTFTQSPFQPLEILIPDGRTEIIFNYGAAYNKFKDHERKHYDIVPGSHFIGMRERAIFLENMHGVQFFAIRFRPGGILPFLQIPAREFTQQHIDLALLFGAVAKEMEERIHEAETSAKKIHIAESVLLSRLRDTCSNHHFLYAALQDIYRSKGQCTIDHISERYGIGYKKLERYFQKIIGCAPKLFMKIVRFSHTVDLLQTQPELSMTDVAYEANYYDQAHFNREFRYLTGNTPKEFKQRQYTISRVIRPKVTYQPSPCYSV